MASFIPSQACNVGFWHKADKPTTPDFVAYWTNNGQRWISARVGYDVKTHQRHSPWLTELSFAE